LTGSVDKRCNAWLSSPFRGDRDVLPWTLRWKAATASILHSLFFLLFQWLCLIELAAVCTNAVQSRVQSRFILNQYAL
jgi:hypothetical protein